jgi:hypothetical protein
VRNAALGTDHVIAGPVFGCSSPCSNVTRICSQHSIRSLSHLDPMTRCDRNIDEIFLLEDNTNSAERGYMVGVGDIDEGSTITISVHRLNGTGKATLARKTYKSGASRRKRAARLEMAAALLAKTAGESPRPIVVAGTSYGSTNAFLQMMADRTLPYVVQIRPSTTVTLLDGKQEVVLTAGKALDHANWKHLKIRMPDECSIECSAAKLGSISLPLGRGNLFAAQVGGIPGIHRGTIIGVSSFDAPLADLVRMLLIRVGFIEPRASKSAPLPRQPARRLLAKPRCSRCAPTLHWDAFKMHKRRSRRAATPA